MDSTKESIKYQRQSPFTLTSESVGVGTEDEETYSEMGQSQSWGERKDHPLLNDVILSNLFEFMRGKDLKSCRLVCKKWCTLTLRSARSKFSVKLHGRDEEMTRKLTDFVEVFRENKLEIPFVKYKLDPFCTTEGPGQEFLQICGNTAKAVTLTQEGYNVSTVKVEDILELLKAMPNIQFFSISDLIHSRSGNIVKLFSDDSSKRPTLPFLRKLVITHKAPISNNRSDIEYCPTFIGEIVSIAPNISDFAVLGFKHGSVRNTIGQVLNAIEKFGRQPVTTTLLLFNDAKVEHFESLRRLAEIGLKLKNLSFYKGLEKWAEEKKCLPQLARLFKNSIERLCVDLVCSSFIQLLHMPKLETLKFRISRDFDSKCVDLNKLFPALKELELNYWDYDQDGHYDWEEFLPNSEPCPNVKSLILRGIFFQSQLLDHILYIFPKLTKFELYVKTDGAEILRRVMTQMTQLEDLTVWGTIGGIWNIDAFLTGIPVQNVKELEHVVTELKEMTVQLRTETIRRYRTRYCHFPSIANLTNLKRLRLSTTVNGPMTRMTDIFLYFGLYSMKHINKLEIEYCEFTRSGCETLTTEIGLETWTFQDRYYRDIIPQVQ